MIVVVSLFTLAPAQKADIAFINGKIWTVDKQKPTARAVAVARGRIIAVGPTAEIHKYVDQSTTKVIDLEGKFMMPGFIDNHARFIEGGFALQRVDLRHVSNETEFSNAVKQYAESHPKQWITGGFWDERQFTTKELPGKELVDLFTPDQGVFVVRYDGTIGLANSVALEMAGITRDTPDPTGGLIEHDKIDGEPTGILKGSAMKLVSKLIPKPAQKEYLEAARLALAEAGKNGVTSVQDITDEPALRIYQTLKSKNELTIRLSCRLPLERVENLVNLGLQAPFGDEWIRVGSLYTQIDGPLGSYEAVFTEPYGSSSSANGTMSGLVESGDVEKWALAADKAHLQLSFDATGDAAVEKAIQIFETVVSENPKWDRRFRIEHASYTAEKDFDRMYGIGAIASAQPVLLLDEARLSDNLLGNDRSNKGFPYKSYLDKKIKLCFGSDWNRAPLNPLQGIYAAASRIPESGKSTNVWNPNQKLTVKEAIEAYSLSSAYAAFEENEKGSIAVGKLADFVVLSDDLITVDVTQIKSLYVEMTIVGGKIVYQR